MDRKDGPTRVAEGRVAPRWMLPWAAGVRRSPGARLALAHLALARLALARRALALLAVALLVPAACAPGPRTVPAPPLFDTARIWIITGTDSIALRVDVASTPGQWERGLMDREVLDPDDGLLFLFEEPRSADDGFWMWRTRMPLDLAALDAEGRITAILAMEPCLERDPEACTEYIPGVPHAGALEVNRGWFARNGVGVGSRVVLP